MEVVVSQEHVGERIDIFVLSHLKLDGFTTLTRSSLHKYWENLVRVNGKDTKQSLKLKEGDRVDISKELLLESMEKEISSSMILPQKGSLDIVFEDRYCLVVNKKAGVVVHPGSGNSENTLSNYVVWYLQNKGEYCKNIKRGGVVHRLDKGVSGLILFAKTLEAQQFFQKQFETQKVEKLYKAKVEGKVFPAVLSELLGSKNMNLKKEIEKLEENNFVCDESWARVEGYIQRSNKNRMKMFFTPLKRSYGNGKLAISYIKPLSKEELLIKIETGRMHQIRATLEYLGLNILGDTLYSTKNGKGGIPEKIELESILLSLENPDGERMTFKLY